ncbi:TPA: Rsd/AlgQ family anti-sigma factor [Photobacterium damselae]|uniref:Regulator of sigma D n=1 Tax=Photobacterium damsela subsp. piscicida TaxID=38294 RepID=A0A1Q9GZV4_PHODP|nr:Rsd/AlgQ family anti-sigma factor [Photobacterium damselae]EJN6961634.1 Rsd/AlgQ family anti-sigma factor [Photobacterium damselae]ELV7515991.1 Rsd/AlgQ family anti-sigma factor [Photobacterium damselae]MBE8130358.1 Rsd/AlgQ family anti-sigma factor [Photobacterium damselae subsp. piscicida]MCG9704491.1 Rsd/AlgQ family anti-sigma factor [Photobacterium damselae]MDP2515683.1 Rsd/AlgQ family anti-sigma factor [Photobacterium damselae subsp. piscicida]
MLSKFEQVKKEWGGHNDVIDQWLMMRQQLLIDYCKLAGLPPNQSARNHLPTPEQLTFFCEQLIDYISAGHFKIYDMVMERWHQTGYSPTEEISAHYQKISLTTEPLLNFAETYVAINDDDNLANFNQHISDLGELLEVRFALEDRLIELISDSLSYPPGA